MNVYRIIFILSLLMMMWSLYIGSFWDPISNIISWELFITNNAIIPCTICWYIRMSSYPLVLISGLWLLYRNTTNRYLLKAFAWITLCLCIYKYLLEMSTINSVLCSVEIPCSDPWLIYGWFITLALMGIVSCIFMLIALYTIPESK